MVATENETYLFEELDEFDNEASASSFGWFFQYNAGIFLFLKNAKKCDTLQIENSNQDIDITLKDNSHIFAQAKSAQDPTATNNNSTKKFTDAIQSLSKTYHKRSKNAESNDQYIYITNISDIFKTKSYNWENGVQPFAGIGEVNQERIKQIINDKLAKLKSEKPSNSMIHFLENFDLNRLYLSSISNFSGYDDKNIDKTVKEEIDKLLIDIGFTDHRLINSVSYQVLSYWRNDFQLSASASKTGNKKTTKGEDLLWQVVACYETDIKKYVTEKCYYSNVDEDVIDDAISYIKQHYIVKTFDFKFSNRVLQNFLKAKRSEKCDKFTFVASHWEDYKNEILLSVSDEVKEFITKYVLVSILNNKDNINNVMKWRGEIT